MESGSRQNQPIAHKLHVKPRLATRQHQITLHVNPKFAALFQDRFTVSAVLSLEILGKESEPAQSDLMSDL